MNHFNARGAVLLALGALLSTGFARADEERDLLLQVCAEKRDAMIAVKGRDGASFGCFIGKDGLAVFHLMTFDGPEAPENYFLLNREPLKAPTLRWFSAELGIAIAKFDYKPKTVIEPSPEALTLGTPLAILDWELKGPVAIGPVTQITKEVFANCLQPRYFPAFSVGAGLPAGRQSPIGPGSPIIDSAGKLRGIFNSARNVITYNLLNGVAADQWFAGIARARAAGDKITIPLSPDLNPYDLASNHPDFQKAGIAALQNNFEEAIKHVKMALEAHPGSPLLHTLHFEIANVAGMTDKLLALAEATKPPAGGSDAAFVSHYTFLAKALRSTGDQAGAGEALRKGLEIAPKEDYGIREEYSLWLELEGRLNEALRYIREASEAAPAQITCLNRQQRLLRQLNRWDEEAKVAERIDELEKLYRPTTSSELRLKKR